MRATPGRLTIRDANAACFVGFVLLSVLLVGSLWIIPYLPTNDGPESILAVHMENHFGDPGTIYRDVFVPAPQFASRGFTLLYEPLEAAFGWQTGLTLALSVLVLAQGWGFVALIAAVSPRRLPLAFLGFPLALSWTLYMGFFAFVASSGLGLFILAFGVGPITTRRRWILSALLLLQAFFHIFPAILTGVALAAWLVARAPRGERARETARAVVLGLPAAGVVLAAVLVARKAAVAVPFSADVSFNSLRASLLSWPRTLAPGPLWRALVVTALVVGSAVFACVSAFKPAGGLRDRAFASVGVVFLLAAFFAPRDVPGWQCFSERFVSLGIALTAAALPIERVTSRRGRLAGALFAASALFLATSYPFHTRLAAESRDVIDGLAAKVSRHGLWLPVTLEPNGRTALGDAEVPLLAPLHHVGALYATAHGGLTPYSFASNPATYPFEIRPDAIHPPPIPPAEHYFTEMTRPEFQTNARFRHQQEDELATYGMFYEGVLVTGARPSDQALFRRRGYVADWEQGSVMIAHFEPCTLDLTLDAGAEEGAPPRVDVAVGAKVPMRDVVPTRTVGPDGKVHLLMQGPCGEVAVKPHWDWDGVDGAVCANSAPGGEIASTLTRTDGVVPCHGRRPAVAR